jgi:hypothetical protein
MEQQKFTVKVQTEDSLLWVRPSGVANNSNVQKDVLYQKVITIFRRWLAKGSISTSEELVLLGTCLYNKLFDQKMTEAFWDDVGRARQQGATLRLVLEFSQDATRLAELPWEYIYFPDAPTLWGAGFFIAADPGLILARHVPLNIKGLKPSGRPLRILIVVSRPKSLSKINAEEIVEALQSLEAKAGDVIKTFVLDGPTSRTLANKIRDTNPHVLHFIGHGQYDDGGGKLALLREDDGDVHWITDRDFANTFGGAQQPPRLIFLHACKGATTDSYDGFKGVALQLVYNRVPAVVAMQYEVENKTANMFAMKFYDALSKGEPIDRAVQEGRWELASYLHDDTFSSRDFGSPVVFLQSPDGPEEIIDPGEIQVATGGEAVTKQGKCPCPYPDNCPGYVFQGDRFCEVCKRAIDDCLNPSCPRGVRRHGMACSRCNQPSDLAGARAPAAVPPTAHPSTSSGFVPVSRS